MILLGLVLLSVPTQMGWSDDGSCWHITIDSDHYASAIGAHLRGHVKAHEQMDSDELAWMWEHYEIRRLPVPDEDREREPHAEHFGLPYLACKRCGMEVYGVTQHARNVHGDDVYVKPPRIANLVRGWSCDPQGRKVVTRPLLSTADWLAQDALLDA